MAWGSWWVAKLDPSFIGMKYEPSMKRSGENYSVAMLFSFRTSKISMLFTPFKTDRVYIGSNTT